MNLTITLLSACLAVTVGQSFAREPQAPPSPSGNAAATTSLKPDAGDSGENVFVGHFGETIRLAYFWAVDASMQGPMEVVNFHLATVDPTNPITSPRFSPTKKEYVPENFARLRLMQMLVIPKDVPGGFYSLAKLREAKAKELAATGGDYKLQDLGGSSWPPDSFQILISKPQRLFQAYTQSDKNFFIVTSGASPYDEHPADPILTNATVRLLGSLSTHLAGFGRQIASERNFLASLPKVLIPALAACAAGLMLCVLPNRFRRLRIIGKAMVGLTGAWHFLAGPILYVAWRLGLGTTLNEASLIVFAGLMTPWICRAMSVRLGGLRPWSVFMGSAIASLFPILLGYSAIGNFLAGTFVVNGADNFWRLSCALSLSGVLNGVTFGLTHREISADGNK